MARPRRRPDPVPPERAALQAHVLDVQRRIRSCAGCGACCTEAYNTMQVLPIEGRRIAGHLARLPPARRAALLERARAAVARWSLRRPGLRRYTCSFLEPDLTCALPADVKPVACLSFNPLTPDRCDQEPDWFEGAWRELRAANRAAALPARRRPIPVAVLEACAPPETRGDPGRRRGR